ISVVDEIDAGIHVTVSDLDVGADVGPPLLGVASNEVVDLSGKLAFSGQLGLVVGSGQLHAQDGGSPRAAGHRGWVESRNTFSWFRHSWVWARAAAKDQHRLCRGYKDAVAAAPRKKLLVRIHLPAVGFKAQRQPCIGLHDSRLRCMICLFERFYGRGRARTTCRHRYISTTRRALS